MSLNSTKGPSLSQYANDGRVNVCKSQFLVFMQESA